MNRKYTQLKCFENSEVERILSEGNIEEYAALGLSVGMYHSVWKYAQSVCLKLSNHLDSWVRANAVLGLSYIALNHKMLEKHLVKPIIIRELRENDEYRWRIVDAAEDINQFMRWDLGKFTLNKIKDK